MNRSFHMCSHLTALFIVVVLSGCSQGRDRDEAKGVAAGITQTMASTGAATNGACKLLTRDEVAAALGSAVGEGSNWSGGGCEWRAGDDVAVQVVMASTRDWEPPARSAGAEVLGGVGLKAFAGPWLGRVRAGALTDTHTVYVTAPSRDVAVRLLRQAVARLPSS